VNKDLYGNKVELPEDVVVYLQKCHDAAEGADDNTEGYRRNKELRDSRSVTYQQLKRMKNWFDNFILNGGNKMKDWVNKTLTTARDNIQNVKDVQKQAGTSVGNTHIKTHTKDGITTNSVKPHSTSDLKIKKESYDDIYIKKEVKLMESLISIFDKNKELWQTDNKSHQF